VFGKRRNVKGSDDAGKITAGTQLKGEFPRRGYTGHEMLDNFSLVHMNGRVYDPGLGRVLSADPIIQAPMMTQSHNRYTYVMNNPLALTDPSGYSWLSKALRGAIFGVFSFIPAIGNRIDHFFATNKFAQFALSSVLTYIGGPAGAALSSAYLTGAAGGSNSDIFMAGLKSGATAFAFELAGGVGDADSAARYAAHAGAGCLSGYANGGSCGRGAATAVAGKWSTNYTDGNFVATVVAGGAVSVLGGGKFANGAQTAAYGYLLNYLGRKAMFRLSHTDDGTMLANAIPEKVEAGLQVYADGIKTATSACGVVVAACRSADAVYGVIDSAVAANNDDYTVAASNAVGFGAGQFVQKSLGTVEVYSNSFVKGVAYIYDKSFSSLTQWWFNQPSPTEKKQ
jgi:RHS repeat-associated protein